MRLPNLLLTAAVGSLIAAAALAQQAEEPAVKSGGLSDLQGTVDGLDDQPQPDAEPQAQAETPAPAATPAPAPRSTTPAPPAPPVTPAQAAQLDQAVARGRQLFAIARAGLLGTQDMLSRVSDPDAAGIAGWIAEPQGNAMLVTFFANGESGPSAVYRAEVLGPRVVSRETFLDPAARPALTPVQARMARARAATEGLDHQACSSQPFNVFVIPPASATAPIDVYQVSVPTQRGRFPLGGHFKSTIAADGSVSSSRGFTNACVDIEAPAVPEGQQPRPIAVTHLLDPMPTEIHVFLSMWAGRPLVVATGEPERLWAVTGERIADIRERPQQRPQGR